MPTLQQTLASHGETLASHSEILASHGESLYELTRFTVATKLQMSKMVKHFGIEVVTEEEIDEVLDAE